MVLQFTPGTRWRYPLLVSRGAKAPATFVTDTIGRDGRFGSVVVKIVSICAAGCHATVEAPCGDCGATHPKMVEVAELTTLRKEDEDGAASSG
jgi:hypothetical protein